MADMTSEDKKLFIQAMQDVVPLKITPKAPPVKKNIPLRAKSSPLALEKTRIDFYDTDQVADTASIFFARPGLQYTVQQKLRQGKLRPQACLDLHGLIVDEARQAVGQFLLMATIQRLPVVKIIHGKGGERGAILRNKVYQWLPQSKDVLAFCSTIVQDGGTGAVYVLLRK